MTPDLVRLLKTNPTDLAREQRDVYADHLIEVLDRAREAVRSLKRDQLPGADKWINDHCFTSPAGDGMGSDDCCLDCSVQGIDDRPIAFGDALIRLERLAAMARSTKEGKK